MAELICVGFKTHLSASPALILFCGFVLAIIRILCVAFFTLLERKLLGLGQARLGPSKTSLLGFIQAFIDVVKLF